MTRPRPQPGMVFSYSFLWRDEADHGRDDGSKDRPCAVLLATTNRYGDTEVLALPITHSQPGDMRYAVEIPTGTKRRIGLDDARSWVIVTETNKLDWDESPDIIPVRGKRPPSVVYGQLPDALYRRIRDKWLAAYDDNKVRTVTRTN